MRENVSYGREDSTGVSAAFVYSSYDSAGH